MNMRDNKTPKSSLLPALVAVIVLCLAGAAVLTLLTRGASPTAAPADQSSLILQRIPFEAQNALRGEATAFDALAKSVARINGLRSALTNDKNPDASWNKLTDAVSKVGEARKAVETIQTANQEARELAPKLLSELGDLASAGIVDHSISIGCAITAASTPFKAPRCRRRIFPPPPSSAGVPMNTIRPGR